MRVRHSPWRRGLGGGVREVSGVNLCNGSSPAVGKAAQVVYIRAV